MKDLRNRTALTVVCSSTRQWNPGDEYIAWGVRRLLRSALPGKRISWVLYDRNPDLFVEPWVRGERRPGLLSNSYQAREALTCDLVVVAGTPEWHGPHLESLVTAHNGDGVPWLFLGLGQAGESVHLNDAEISILQNSLVTTRDNRAAQSLRSYSVNATLMPCPSIFGSPLEQPTRVIRRVGLVLQSDQVINQRVSTRVREQTLRLAEILQDQYELTIICNYIQEFAEFQPLFGDRLAYSYESSDYLELLADCDLVLSTRLHSAFLASSLLKAAVVLNDEPRVQYALAGWPYVACWHPEEVVGRLASLELETWIREQTNQKRIAEEQYVHLLRDHLERHGFC